MNIINQMNFEKIKLRLEHFILGLAVSEVEKLEGCGLLKFRTTKRERREIAWNVGQLGRRVDDFIDNYRNLVNIKDLEKFVVDSGPCPKVKDRTAALWLKEIKQCRDYIFSKVGPTKYKNEFCRLGQRCIRSHLMPSNTVAQVLKMTENKGGPFSLAIVLAMNPEHVSQKVKAAVYWAGVYIQVVVDGWADRFKDEREGVPTIYAISKNPERVLQEQHQKYRTRVISFLGREDIFIPTADKLFILAKLGSLPGISALFSRINS